MVRRFVAFALLAACGGVSDDPPAGWEDALDAFATAHCEWNHTCDARNEPTCVAETTGVMNGNRESGEVPAAQIDECIACMEAWTAAYVASTSPCASQLSFDDSQAVAAACMAINCVELHDLPGSNPQ